jgi:hypothetical protein
MDRLRKNSVYVALHGTIGRDLIFRHYTNKVVAATHPENTPVQLFQRLTHPGRKMKEANDYAQLIMCNPALKALYEKYLKEGETVYKKAISEYFAMQMPKPSLS